MAKDREPRSFLWLPSSNFRCFEQRSEPVHLDGQQIIIQGTKIKICHQKRGNDSQILLQRLSNPISCGLGKDLQHRIKFLKTSFRYFQGTHSLRRLFSETCWCKLDIPWSSFPWYQCSVRLSLLTLFHSIYPTAAVNSPHISSSSCVSSWKFPLSLPKPSVSPFPLKGSRNIHLCAAPALAGKMKWKKSDPCGKTFCWCKVCTFFGGWHLSLKMSQSLSALSVWALVGCLGIWQSIFVIVIWGLPEL